MPLPLAIAALLVGFVLIARAADEFVVGAARLSLLMGVSPLVVGAVIVGFGTSAPEMLVAGTAALDGLSDLAVGNVIGANIANLTLALGVAALIATVPVTSRMLRREVPVSFGACLAFLVVVNTGGPQRIEGVVLLVLLAVSLGLIVRWGRVAAVDELPLALDVEEYLHDRMSSGRELVRTIGAIVAVVIAAQLLVAGASTIAVEVGLGDAVIGFTLVTLGTSLPELVTGIAAARRNETDLIVGNILGSNLFNSLGVGAVIAFLGPGSLDRPEVVTTASLALLGVLVLVAGAMASRSGISRAHGGVLVVAYLVAVATVIS